MSKYASVTLRDFPEVARQRLAKQYWHRVRVADEGCWSWDEKFARFVDGYLPLRCSIRGTIYQTRAHRAAFELFSRDLQEGELVLHTCDNRACTNPDHLYAGSQRDNVADRVRRQRSHRPTGESHPQAYLTDARVLDLRQMFALDMRYRKSLYGVVKRHWLAEEPDLPYGRFAALIQSYTFTHLPTWQELMEDIE